MVNVKTGQLTLGGQFDAYKRGQLERNIHINPFIIIKKNKINIKMGITIYVYHLSGLPTVSKKTMD